VALMTTIAIGRSLTLRVARNVDVNGKREAIVVDSKGLSVYELLPESTKHPLCTQKCLSFWPPVTVGARTRLSKGPGVNGKIGRWHRGSIFQVTLGGHPLYTYSGDAKTRGVARGDKVPGPGRGIWHVIRASSSQRSSTTVTTTTTTTTTTSSYSYPVPLY
jgi:predicted lipoprotein with Yx(FWY)xxD motif